jgi:hypothetical protein
MARPAKEAAKNLSVLTEVEAPLFGLKSRTERLRQMTPERRAAYERIVKLREAIGPIDFDVSEAVQQLRQNG